MKSFVKISKAITMVMCMMFGLVLFTGCPGDGADARESFVGSYKVTETVAGQLVDEYNIMITKSSVSSTDIILTNFFGVAGWSVNATVSGINFTIPQQSYMGGLFGAHGSGRRDGNTLNYSTLVTISGESGQLNLVVTAIKQ